MVYQKREGEKNQRGRDRSARKGVKRGRQRECVRVYEFINGKMILPDKVERFCIKESVGCRS